MYRIHVQSVVRRGLMQHLHISKSGGTSFSEAAGKSNCSMYTGVSQPRYLDDYAHWLNATAFTVYTGVPKVRWARYGQVRRSSDVQTCEQRAGAVVSDGIQYLSNEYTLLGGLQDMWGTHVCPQFVNAVTLRSPEKRLVSHLTFVMSHLSASLPRNVPSEPDLLNRLFCSGNHSVWYDVAPPVFDNYITRSFLGESGFHTPPGQLGPGHVSLARALLLQFDLVLDLEAGPEAARGAMRQGLGWNVTLAEIRTRTARQVLRRHGFDLDAEGCRNEALLREVLPRQEPDRQLYRTGRAVAFLDALWLSMARSLGLRPHPDTATQPHADTADDKSRYPCGLLSFAAAGRPPRPVRRGRLPSPPRQPSEAGIP